MTIRELNKRLNKVNLNLRCDFDGTHYDTWVEYYNHSSGKWGVLSVVGRYMSKERAIKSAISWLEVQKVKY